MGIGDGRVTTFGQPAWCDDALETAWPRFPPANLGRRAAAGIGTLSAPSDRRLNPTIGEVASPDAALQGQALSFQIRYAGAHT